MKFLLIITIIVLTGCSSSEYKKENYQVRNHQMISSNVEDLVIQPRVGVSSTGGRGILSGSASYSSNHLSDDGPVWVIAKTARIYIPAKRSKDGLSLTEAGYKSVVIEPGHWATESEVQIAGKAYLKGSGDLILPVTGTSNSLNYMEAEDVYRYVSANHDQEEILKARIDELTRAQAEQSSINSELKNKLSIYPENIQAIINENRELKNKVKLNKKEKNLSNVVNFDTALLNQLNTFFSSDISDEKKMKIKSAIVNIIK